MLVIIDGDTDNALAAQLRLRGHTVLAAPLLPPHTEKHWLALIAARNTANNGIYTGTVYATRSHHTIAIDTGATVHILATKNAAARARDLSITHTHARSINNAYWDAYFKMQQNCKKGNYIYII
jgi:hypothetical protein